MAKLFLIASFVFVLISFAASVKETKTTTATGEAALGDELDELTRRLEKSTI